MFINNETLKFKIFLIRTEKDQQNNKKRYDNSFINRKKRERNEE